MDNEQEIDGAALVRWIARDVASRLPRLVGSIFADDNFEWRIAQSDGALITLIHDSARPKAVHYAHLERGSVYVSADSKIFNEVRTERPVHEKRVEDARAMLNRLRLVGSARLDDGAAVRLYDIVNPWFSARRLPTLEQAQEAREYFERASPATRQACDLMNDWLSASTRETDEIGFRIQYGALLRSAWRPDEALAATDVLLKAQGWPWGNQARAILLTIRAAALMDLFERKREIDEAEVAHKLLPEARKCLGNAYAIQGRNDHLLRTYQRLEALEVSLRDSPPLSRSGFLYRPER